MRVAIKLALALLPCAVVVLALSGWLSIRREQALIEQDIRHDMRVWGRSLAELVRQVWQDEGPAAAEALVTRVAAGMEDVHLRWLWVPAEIGAPTPLERVDAAGLRRHLLAGESVSLVAPASHADDPGRIFSYVFVGAQEGRLAALEIEESLVGQRTVVWESVRQVAGSTLAMGGLFAILAIVTGLHVVGRPTQTLLDVARRVGEGDFSRRVVLPQRDEIGALADEMNAMCDRLLEARARLEEEVEARIETLDRLRHADRLATLGQIAAGLAHEVGTPLSVAKGWAEMIAAGGLSPEETRDKGEKVVELCRRISRTIRLTLDFARRRPPHKSPHDLRRLTRRTMDLLENLARRHQVELSGAEGEPITAWVDGSQIEQVVTNLLLNAIHASPPGGRVEAEVWVERRAPPEDGVRRADRRGLQEVSCLLVRDRGEGIAPEHLVHLWEPFFTTRPTGQGTGLGLPIARGIVEEHGGWIEVETTVGAGTTFRVFLPRDEAVPEPTSAPPPAADRTRWKC